MICEKPFMAGAIPFGCGKCQPCLINRRRLWQWRQYLEALCHEHNCFVTLTYDDSHLPGSKSVSPEEVQLWLKRLRAACGNVRIRYFCVGEYGDTTERPHYHASLFGVSSACVFKGREFTELVNTSWGRGFTMVAEFNEYTAQYVCGYVTKNMRHETAYSDGRHPEFARMSLKPGIGADAMNIISMSLQRGLITADQNSDVPTQLHVGRKALPLGRYLIKKLREEVGYTEEYAKSLRDEISYQRSLEMCALFQAGEFDTFRQVHARSIGSKIEQVKKRQTIFTSRRSL